MSQARAEAIDAAYYGTLAALQAAIDAEGVGQQVILNGLDDADSAHSHASAGCAGSMFDHFSILQFLDAATGAFDVPKMEAAIELAAAGNPAACCPTSR